MFLHGCETLKSSWFLIVCEWVQVGIGEGERGLWFTGQFLCEMWSFKRGVDLCGASDILTSAWILNYHEKWYHWYIFKKGYLDKHGMSLVKKTYSKRCLNDPWASWLPFLLMETDNHFRGCIFVTVLGPCFTGIWDICSNTKCSIFCFHWSN